MRVILLALALTVLAFVMSVMGDLSQSSRTVERARIPLASAESGALQCETPDRYCR
jgi:hypothetical protein